MDQIILDQKTFKALAADTRVLILKFLRDKRKTASDISKHLGLSQPTIAEHLEKMVSAGLISKKLQGKKWIYYQLTPKGERILNPKPTTLFAFLMSIALVALVFGSLNLFTFGTVPKYSAETNYAAVTTYPLMEKGSAPQTELIQYKVQQTLNFGYLVIVLFGAGISLYVLYQILRS